MSPRRSTAPRRRNERCFDSSKEGHLARKYEAAAERTLFRALREFRQVEKEAKTEAEAEPPPEEKTNPNASASPDDWAPFGPTDREVMGAFPDAKTVAGPVSGVATVPMAAPPRV